MAMTAMEITALLGVEFTDYDPDAEPHVQAINDLRAQVIDVRGDLKRLVGEINGDGELSDKGKANRLGAVATEMNGRLDAISMLLKREAVQADDLRRTLDVAASATPTHVNGSIVSDRVAWVTARELRKREIRDRLFPVGVSKDANNMTIKAAMY